MDNVILWNPLLPEEPFHTIEARNNFGQIVTTVLIDEVSSN